MSSLPSPRKTKRAAQVLILGVVLSVAATILWQKWLQRRTSGDIVEQAIVLEAQISSRVESYLAMLRGGAGLFAASREVTRAEFKNYIAPIDIDRNYPGTQGIGFTQRIPAGELATFEERERAAGRPNFRVWPDHPREEYHSIVFLEPEDERNLAAVGFDMFAEPMRRNAMERARDTARAAISGRVTLVQEIDENKQPGFLIYFPVYKKGRAPEMIDERRASLLGFIYAPFRAHDFLRGMVLRAENQALPVAVFDGAEPTADRLFYGAIPDERQSSWFNVHLVRSLTIVDRTWTLVYSAPVMEVLPWWGILAAGLLTTFGVYLLVWREQRALERAELSEAETREREGEIALLVDAIPGMVAFVDAQGVFRMFNRRLQEWFGVQPKELIGRSIKEGTRPVTYKALEHYIERAQRGESVSFEHWFNPGKTNPATGFAARYLALHLVPHASASGQFLGFYVVSSDLTAHKRAEEGARFVADCSQLLLATTGEQEMLRGLVRVAVPRVADVAAVFRVVDGKLITAAVAHADSKVEDALNAQLTGTQIGTDDGSGLAEAARTGAVAVLPEVILENLGGELGQPAQRELLKRLNLRTVLHIPVVVRGRVWAVLSLGTTSLSGRRFSAGDVSLGEEVSTRMRLAVENAMLFAEAQQEVIERRRAQDEVRATEERLRLFVAGARDYAMLMLNADGRIASWNEGAERILGFTEHEAVGMHFAQLFSEDDRQALLPEAELRIAAETGVAPDERWHVRKDGTRFWASGHTVRLQGPDGTPRGFAKIMRDLTGMKLTEEELEQRVRQRTLELNEAIQELEAFSYSVSHDLRAPLRSIRSFTQFTLEEAGQKLNEDERSYLDRAQRAAARLDRLISDLLAYTRVSKNRVELSSVDLDALVGDIQREHDEFREPAARVRIDGPLGLVTGNEAYLTQCITNLLGNAVKFVPEGRMPEVHIYSERHGTNVRLNVSDNGIGIAPEHQSRIFEIFERLHRGADYEGTGVGLAIVRRAVQRMNGTIGLSSEIDKGSTFWIELPASTVPPTMRA
jgi:PAS domain S-box-containing protein